MLPNRKFTHPMRENIFFYQSVDISIHPDHDVDVGKWKVGPQLISHSFGPCQAVVAILKNGEYGIYHAYSGFKTKVLMAFVDAIKGNVQQIFVIQKNNPINNLNKAPYLTIELARELDCNVRRLHIEDYRGVYVNAEEKQIIFFENYNCIKGEKTSVLVSKSGEQKHIDAYEHIGLMQTAEELCDKHRDDLTVDEKGHVTANDVVIPAHFISESLFERLNSQAIMNENNNEAVHIKKKKRGACNIM